MRGLLLVFYSKHGPKCTVYELRTWNRQTDGQTAALRTAPYPRAGHNKAVKFVYNVTGASLAKMRFICGRLVVEGCSDGRGARLPWRRMTR